MSTTTPRPWLSTTEWGFVVLLALLAVAAALAYFANSTTLLDWLKWGAEAYVAWALLLMVPKWRRTFQEGRQRGGAAEGVRRVLGPGPSIRARFALSFGMILVWFLGTRYLRGTSFQLFGDLFIIACLSLIAWVMFKTPLVPREGRASGIFVIVVFLTLVASLGLLLGLPNLQR